jgi:hypothetical protein
MEIVKQELETQDRLFEPLLTCETGIPENFFL